MHCNNCCDDIVDILLVRKRGLVPTWCQVICNHRADSLQLVSDRFALWDFQRKSHDSDVIMSTAMSQITGVSIVYSTICSGADQRKHQNSASLTFVRGIHRWPVDSPHKAPVTRKMFPFGDVIMNWAYFTDQVPETWNPPRRLSC